MSLDTKIIEKLAGLPRHLKNLSNNVVTLIGKGSKEEGKKLLIRAVDDRKSLTSEQNKRIVRAASTLKRPRSRYISERISNNLIGNLAPASKKVVKKVNARLASGNEAYVNNPRRAWFVTLERKIGVEANDEVRRHLRRLKKKKTSKTRDESLRDMGNIAETGKQKENARLDQFTKDEIAARNDRVSAVFKNYYDSLLKK